MNFYAPRLSLVFFLFISCSQDKTQEENWQALFNGKSLEGWDTYLGPSRPDTVGFGLNQDPQGVFSVAEENGVGILRVSGELFGGISTQQDFSNYHFKLDFKWGNLKWPPRENGKRDSGLLYHAVGPHGADYGYWMRSQEFQIQEGDCGDYWGVAGGIMDIPAVFNAKDSLYIYSVNAPPIPFSTDHPNGRHCVRLSNEEKPHGEWNTLELFCLGDTAIHRVNGKVVMVLYHSRQKDGTREKILDRGKIQIQSEGAEVFYRNIQIRSLNKLPQDLLSGK